MATWVFDPLSPNLYRRFSIYGKTARRKGKKEVKKGGREGKRERHGKQETEREELLILKSQVWKAQNFRSA